MDMSRSVYFLELAERYAIDSSLRPIWKCYISSNKLITNVLGIRVFDMEMEIPPICLGKLNLEASPRKARSVPRKNTTT